MFIDEMKSSVAQNCPGYDPPNDITQLSNSATFISCYHCANFKDGKCKKDYFGEVSTMLTRN